jgi:hypothetical protein
MEKRLLNKVLRVVMGVSLFHLFTFSPLPALADESADLKALYQQIDDAISQSPQYVAERERQIAACRDSLLREKNEEKNFQTAKRLFWLYEPYKNDSALYYAELCISLANTLHRPDLVGRFRSLLAYQCSRTDRHAESLEQLSLIDRSALDNRGLVDYYHAWMHVCGELGQYTQRENVRLRYYNMQDAYRDSVLMVAEEGSEEWYHLKVDILNARRLYQDALELSDQWNKKVTDDTHEAAYAAFYRSMVYDKLKNHDMTCYWLGKSALDDIKCAVMNQASLLFLAEHLADDGDIDRAHRYMEFAKDCNQAFTPQLRNYQVNPIVNIVEKNCHDTLARADRILKIVIGVIVLLLIALLYTLSIIRKTRSKGTQ